MQEPTKKLNADEGLVTIRLRAHPNNAEKIKEYAQSIETGSERNYTVAEVFPEYIGKEQQTAIRAYSHRKNITQRQLPNMIGILQRHIGEMKNAKELSVKMV